MELGEIGTVNHEGKPIEIGFSVTHQRVEHYSDVVEHLVNTEIIRCRTVDGYAPMQRQIDFLRRQIVRSAIIQHDIERAQGLRIAPLQTLNETKHCIPAGVKLQQ